STAIIKVGRHFGKIKNILSALDLISKATVIENATRPNERIRKVEDVEGDSLPYFTTILVYTGSESW
ncbi:MAG: precorrin-2 C(20)-methyltransferase, partial [Aestuariivirga sp.]